MKVEAEDMGVESREETDSGEIHCRWRRDRFMEKEAFRPGKTD